MYSSRSRHTRRSPSRRAAGGALAGALALALAAPLALPVLAQEAPKPLKVAVLDTEQVLLSSQTGKKAMEELKVLRDRKTEEGKAMETTLKDLQTKLTDGKLSLSDDKLADLQKQYEDKVIEMRRFQDDANRELSKKRDELLAKVDAQVMPIINAYGAQQGYDMIFRKFDSGLIFANQRIDITQEVIRQLDSGAPASGQ